MSRTLFILVFLFLAQANLHAQIGDVIPQRTHKRMVKRTSPKVQVAFSTEKLAMKITRGQTSAEAKSQAIFNWIATNIPYDNELRASKSLQKQIYTSEAKVIQSVLERRKALCGGYALLYQDLARHVGLKTAVIHGYSKSYAGTKRKSDQVNHTWNAVEINGVWKLVDITWAQSHSKNGNPNMFWYGTPPKDFIKTHYPEHKKWTLLRDPMSLREFDNATH